MSSSSSFPPPPANPSSKMLKDFLRDDPPPRDSSMFSSFEAVLAKAFKAVLSRSRRASKVREREAEAEAKATVVKIKDIVRWTSFRDLVEDVPLGSYGSECFAPLVTGSTSSSCTTSSSDGNGSSWCESDFGEEFSPAWRETTKCFFANKTKMVSSFCDDKEQPAESPVSVVSFQFGENEDVYVNDRSREDKGSSDDVEDRARFMLNHVIELSNNSMIAFEPHVERLLLDFFTNDELEGETVDTARLWIEGELHGANEWGIGGRKDAYIKEMDEAGMWTWFEEGEKMGIVLEVETYLFDMLMKEVLVDCLAH